MKIIKSNRLAGIDIMKFIMAFAVLTIHVQVFFSYNYPSFINWFIRLAVPFYFLSSGYLTAQRYMGLSDKNEKAEYLRHKGFRFGRMFMLWIIIYMPFSIIDFEFNSPSLFIKDVALYIFKIIVTGESRFAWPLWYLYSSMVAYLLFGVLCKLKNFKYYAVLLSIITIAGVLFAPHIHLSNMIQTMYNGVFERLLGGFPYIAIGFLLFRYKEKLTGWVAMLLNLGLSYILFIFGVMGLFPLFGGVAMFLFSNSLQLPGGKLYYKLNVISIWIYLTHMFNILIFNRMIEFCGFVPEQFLSLLIVSVFTLLTSSILFGLSNLSPFGFLKQLV